MSDDRLTVEFLGEHFATAEKLGLMPMLRFAKLAKDGIAMSDMNGLAALYDVLEQSIAPDDWERLCEHASTQRAGGQELMQLVADVVGVLSSGRPTSRPSDSSDGSPTMSEKSADDSSSQVIADLEALGRPDLALIVTQAQAALG